MKKKTKKSVETRPKKKMPTELNPNPYPDSESDDSHELYSEAERDNGLHLELDIEKMKQLKAKQLDVDMEYATVQHGYRVRVFDPYPGENVGLVCGVYFISSANEDDEVLVQETRTPRDAKEYCDLFRAAFLAGKREVENAKSDLEPHCTSVIHGHRIVKDPTFGYRVERVADADGKAVLLLQTDVMAEAKKTLEMVRDAFAIGTTRQRLSLFDTEPF